MERFGKPRLHHKKRIVLISALYNIITTRFHEGEKYLDELLLLFFKMERILDQRLDDTTGQTVYLIQWQGYKEPIYNSWIPHDLFLQLREYLSPVEQSILVGDRPPLATFPPPRPAR